ncbi:MAG: hypothetical protein H7281_17855, partial [Bacteriovorax sp.]|nr:hypothetical protein [Bacteriovorax sp.]
MKLIFLILCLNIFGKLSAAEVEIDKIKKDDNIETIAKRNIYKFKLKYNNRLTDFQEDIKKWNPLISDWSQPPENQNIYIDYPYSSFL